MLIYFTCWPEEILNCGYCYHCVRGQTSHHSSPYAALSNVGDIFVRSGNNIILFCQPQRIVAKNNNL